MNHLTWRKSTRCSTSNCVEIATDTTAVLMRDSKDTTQPPLTFNRDTWRGFLTAVRSGDFDQP
jgi:hypothetical protein